MLLLHYKTFLWNTKFIFGPHSIKQKSWSRKESLVKSYKADGGIQDLTYEGTKYVYVGGETKGGHDYIIYLKMTAIPKYIYPVDVSYTCTWL